jgi:uncharacterized membrane protein (DUF485 family)
LAPVADRAERRRDLSSVHSNMLSDREKTLLNSDAWRRFAAARGRLAWGLAAALIALVMVFNFTAAFAPDWFGRPLWPGTVYSIGVIFAFAVIVLVLCAAVFFVYRLNRDYARFKDAVDDGGH